MALTLPATKSVDVDENELLVTIAQAAGATSNGVAEIDPVTGVVTVVDLTDAESPLQLKLKATGGDSVVYTKTVLVPLTEPAFVSLIDLDGAAWVDPDGPAIVELV